MNRLLTVKGIGRATTKPDMVIVGINLTVTTPEYPQTMDAATKDIEALRVALCGIGYEREALKTTDFNISTEYENKRQPSGEYFRRFMGYKCTHALKLEIDFDMKQLGETLAAVSACGVKPELQISFSVKDKSAVNTALLESAITNAKDKAAILAKAGGVKLGSIQHIDYSWGELRLYSHTRPHFDGLEEMTVMSEAAMIDIEPEDITVDDSVTVVWAIE